MVQLKGLIGRIEGQIYSLKHSVQPCVLLKNNGKYFPQQVVELIALCGYMLSGISG